MSAAVLLPPYNSSTSKDPMIFEEGAYERNFRSLGGDHSRRRCLVPCAEARNGPAHYGFARRSECRRCFLQLRVSCGKVQHAGYTQGAACRAAYQRIRVVLRHGPNPLLHYRGYSWLARSDRRKFKRQTGGREIRAFSL